MQDETIAKKFSTNLENVIKMQFKYLETKTKTPEMKKYTYIHMLEITFDLILQNSSELEAAKKKKQRKEH